MGFLKVFGSLSRSASPSRSTGDRRIFDEKAVASFFCHGRADSLDTIQLASELQVEARSPQIGSTTDGHDKFVALTDPEVVSSHGNAQAPDAGQGTANEQDDHQPGASRFSLLDIVITDPTGTFASDSSSSEHNTPQDIPLFFGRLPAEIRNHIYLFALVPDEAVDISVAERPRPRVPPLLQTCRQLRHEASGIYYGETTFTHHFQTHVWRTLFDGPLIDWLKAIGPEACSQLRHLTLTHRIIDATGQVFSAFDSFVKVTGSPETDSREFMGDLGALGVVVREVKVESATDAVRRRRIATAGNDTPWIRALEAAKNA